MQYLPKGTDEKKEASLVMHRMHVPDSEKTKVLTFKKAYSQGNVYNFLSNEVLLPASPFDASVWKNTEKKLVLMTEVDNKFEAAEVDKVHKLLAELDSKKYSGFTFGYDDSNHATLLGDSKDSKGKKILILN